MPVVNAICCGGISSGLKARENPLLGVKKRVFGDTPRGLEPLSENNGKTRKTPEGGTESGTVGPETAGQLGSEPPAMPADLARVVSAWPNLPPAIRAAVLAIIEATASEGKR